MCDYERFTTRGGFEKLACTRRVGPLSGLPVLCPGPGRGCKTYSTNQIHTTTRPTNRLGFFDNTAFFTCYFDKRFFENIGRHVGVSTTRGQGFDYVGGQKFLRAASGLRVSRPGTSPTGIS